MWLKFLILIVSVILVVCGGVRATKSLRTSFQDNGILFSDLEKDSSIAPLVDPVDGISYRLPNNTIPLAYNIWLSTHLDRVEYDGQVTIRIECVETTPEIILHYRLMTISTVTLLDSNNNLIQVNVPFTQNATVEFLVIRPGHQLIQGNEYLVTVTYNGTMRDDGRGFSYNSYIDPEGNTRYWATTLFLPTDGRHAFPCYDEPMFRSQFTLSIRHHQDFIALSNMNVVERISEPGNEYALTRFAESPRMQSYLVAFSLSEFTFIEDGTVVPPQRIYGRSERIANGDGELALATSIELLGIMEDYTGIDYTFPKLDQHACPEYLSAIVENWGLIMYRESFLLWDRLLDRTRDRDNIIVVMSHGLIHQWFGNLVSPAWWSYLWLSEGFGILYEFFIPHTAYPEDRYMDTFLYEYLHVALENDADPNVRALTHYAESPEGINNLNDIVASNKAASVFYTIQNALGHETWRKGLQYFLQARQDNFTNPAHLYAAVQQAVNEDFPTNPPNVEAIMQPWELQAGVPIVTVSRSGNTLNFHQTRFSYTSDSSDSIWQIPINYVVGSNPNFNVTLPDFWLTGRELNIQSDQAPKPWNPNDWIIVNIQQSGYYRVGYDEELGTLIGEVLNSPQYDLIHVLNRAQLVDDVFHIARAGLLTFDIPLEAMNYLERETDHTPWHRAEQALFWYNRWLAGTSVYDEFQDYVLKNVDALYDQLGVTVIDNEPRLNRYARQIAINLACFHGSPRCLAESAQQIENLIFSQQTLHPDVAAQIYCNGIRRSNSTVISAFHDDVLFFVTRQPERNSIIAGLGCMEDTTILNNHLLMSVRPGPYSNAERQNMLTSVLNNGNGPLQVLMDVIRSQYGGINLLNPNLIQILLSNIALRISTQEMFDEFSFLLTHLQINGVISEDTVDTLRLSAQGILDWQEENLDDIIAFFERQKLSL